MQFHETRVYNRPYYQVPASWQRPQRQAEAEMEQEETEESSTGNNFFQKIWGMLKNATA